MRPTLEVESPFSQAPRPLAEVGRRLVVAHRGASAIEAENTLPAFERAIAAGADAVELDVRLTADGHAVVLHDADVSRMTDGRGPVRGLSLPEVKRLRIATSHGDAAEIPTLQEALDLCLGRVAVDIELKNVPGEPDFDPERQSVAEAVARMLATIDAAGRVLVTSFNPLALEALRAAFPEVDAGILVTPGTDPDAALAFACERGFAWVLPPVGALAGDAEGVAARAHGAGLRVGTWTTDAPAEAVRLLRAGLDAVATNDPDAVVPPVREAFGP